MTARWVVDEVLPERDIDVAWQPISLLVKNRPAPGGESYGRYQFTHNLLRVMESVRSGHGEDAVFPFYWELGKRIHHDGDRSFEPAAALAAVGLDGGHAAAFDDAGWDAEIERRMDVGLELAGTDVGTPIIAFPDGRGATVGIFGPVITRVPGREESLRLWDAVVAMATTPGFWELKRTRTERPDFGPAPAPIRFGGG